MNSEVDRKLKMNESPLVSIILPIYNVELYLAECLDSILEQSYRNFELITINDGSTDRSMDIVLKYQAVFAEKLIIVEQKNKGLSAARNTGLDKVKGEFVYFLDSDDWILPDTLEKCVRELNTKKSDLIVFNAKAFCDDMPIEMLGKLDYTRNLPVEQYTNGHQLFVDSRNSAFYIVQSCCYMYRFSPHADLRFIDGILHEDNYFTTMLFLCSGRISVLNDRFFQRRIRKNSITTSSLTIKHAIGYYKSASILSDDLSKKSIHSKEISDYLNYLIQVGFRIEREINQSHITFKRKLEIINNFKKIINYKVFTRILIPELYAKIVILLRKTSILM